MNTNTEKKLNLYYVLDPMCSWCWAFGPSWRGLIDGFDSTVGVRYVMGGLAPDSDEPMPESMRRAIQQTWRTIEQRTGAVFNHDFWEVNTPLRSTYPACRAAIAAGTMRDGGLVAMVEAIQQAYYLHARNPSSEQVLCDIAESIGLDQDEFARVLRGDEVRAAFARNLELVRRMGVQGFPAVVAVLKHPNQDPRYALVSAGYCDPAALSQRWQRALRDLEGVS